MTCGPVFDDPYLWCKTCHWSSSEELTACELRFDRPVLDTHDIAGLSTALTPKEVVAELDRNIVGQPDAKKAVAIALSAPSHHLHSTRSPPGSVPGPNAAYRPPHPVAGCLYACSAYHVACGLILWLTVYALWPPVSIRHVCTHLTDAACLHTCLCTCQHTCMHMSPHMYYSCRCTCSHACPRTCSTQV